MRELFLAASCAEATAEHVPAKAAEPWAAVARVLFVAELAEAFWADVRQLLVEAVYRLVELALPRLQVRLE